MNIPNRPLNNVFLRNDYRLANHTWLSRANLAAYAAINLLPLSWLARKVRG